MASWEKYRNDPEARHCPIDIQLLTTVCYIFKGNDGVKEYMPKIRELSDRILTGDTIMGAGLISFLPLIIKGIGDTISLLGRSGGPNYPERAQA